MANIRLRTTSGQPLRSEYTALEAAVLVHAANFCDVNDYFSGVPSSNEERYRRNETEYFVNEKTENKITVCVQTGKNGGKLLQAIIVKKSDNNNNNNNKNMETTNVNERVNAAETSASTNGTNNMVNQLLQGMMEAAYNDGYNKATAAASDKEAELMREIEDLKNRPSGAGTVINININGREETRETEKVYHDKFASICEKIANGENIYLWGPAGTGKNVIAEQVAETLGLENYYYNTLYTKYDVTGFMDANGNFVRTVMYNFLKSEKPALLFFDEMDNSQAEAMIAVNDLLASGKMTFANGETLYLNKDKHIIAAGNTDGRGATEEYNGRYKMDESTRSRFWFVKIDYCRKIEESIVGNSTEILEFVDKLRTACEQTGIKLILGYREIVRLKKYENEDKEDVINGAILKGLDKNAVRELQNVLQYDGGFWLDAFHNI